MVAAWTSDEESGDGNDVYVRRFGSGGTPDGDAFRINDLTTTGAEADAVIAAVADGSFVVTWNAKSTDSVLGDTFGKRFDAEGHSPGLGFGEFRVYRKP